MALKFNVTYNTPSDWVKAITAGFTAGAATYGTVQSNGVTPLEWVGVIVAAITAFFTVLGIYSAQDHVDNPSTVTPPVEPVTFKSDNALRAAATSTETQE
jgi:hypothetical protein